MKKIVLKIKSLVVKNTPKKEENIIFASKYIIKKYEKTFLDLARYDKGQKPSRN